MAPLPGRAFCAVHEAQKAGRGLPSLDEDGALTARPAGSDAETLTQTGRNRPFAAAPYRQVAASAAGGVTLRHWDAGGLPLAEARLTPLSALGLAEALIAEARRALGRAPGGAGGGEGGAA